MPCFKRVGNRKICNSHVYLSHCPKWRIAKVMNLLEALGCTGDRGSYYGHYYHYHSTTRPDFKGRCTEMSNYRLRTKNINEYEYSTELSHL